METEIFEGYDNFLKGWTRIKEHDGSTVAYTPDRITAETFIHATTLFPELVQWLNVILDQVDYTKGACSLTEMVGAALDRRVIEQARTVLAKAKGGQKG